MATVGGLSSTINSGDHFAYSPSPCASSPDAHFVCAVYRDLLGRSPEPAGLSFWLAQLSGGRSPTEVALGIDSSSEYRDDLVAGWYQSYLHRAPDAMGGEQDTSLLAHGVSDETVQADILASDEYFGTTVGGTDPGFVSALYRDLLGRGASPSDLAFWDGLISAGATRHQVAADLLGSTEYRNGYVAGLYQRLLRRSASPTEVAGWVNLMSHGASDEKVVAGITGSPEYFALAQAS